jgi:hypothetical protein
MYNLSVLGLATNKASIRLWRHERLPLPLKYLHDECLLTSLKSVLDIAEKVGQQLRESLWYLSKSLIMGERDRMKVNRILEVSFAQSKNMRALLPSPEHPKQLIIWCCTGKCTSWPSCSTSVARDRA